MPITRRSWAKTLAATAATLSVGRASAFAAPEPSIRPASATGASFELGIAGYTIRDFSLDECLVLLKRWGITQWALKDRHLALDSSAEACAAFRQKCTDAGITLYAAGVIQMKTPADVERAFTHGQRLGVGILTCAPEIPMLPAIEAAVKATGIRVAIHNHGPDSPLFPTVESIVAEIKDLHPNVGICHDIGHTTRAGFDPLKGIELAGSRLFDVHFKDVTSPTKEGGTVPLGRGVIDLHAVVAKLKSIGYRGLCAMEYESDKVETLAGMAENIGYWRGTRGCQT